MKKTVLLLSLLAAFGSAHAGLMDYVPEPIKQALGLSKPKPVVPPAKPQNPSFQPQISMAPQVQGPEVVDLTKPAVGVAPSNGLPGVMPNVPVADQVGMANLKALEQVKLPPAQVSNPAAISVPASNPFTGKASEIEAKQRALEESRLQTQLLEEQIKQANLQQELVYAPVRNKADVLAALKDHPDLAREVTGKPKIVEGAAGTPKSSDGSTGEKKKVEKPKQVVKKGPPKSTGGLVKLTPKQTEYDLKQDELRFKQAVASAPVPIPSAQFKPSKEIALSSVLGSGTKRTALLDISGQVSRFEVGQEVLPGVQIESISENSVALTNGKVIKMGSSVGKQAVVDSMKQDAKGVSSGSASGGAIKAPEPEQKPAVATSQPVSNVGALFNQQPQAATQPQFQPNAQNRMPPPPPLPNSLK